MGIMDDQNDKTATNECKILFIPKQTHNFERVSRIHRMRDGKGVSPLGPKVDLTMSPMATAPTKDSILRVQNQSRAWQNVSCRKPDRAFSPRSEPAFSSKIG